jgi:putative Ca2+/H+ antiporter (TMEM165/GDT1 family)
VTTAGIGMLAGSALAQHINEKYLRYIAGTGFIGIGIWMLVKVWHASNPVA